MSGTLEPEPVAPGLLIECAAFVRPHEELGLVPQKLSRGAGLVY